MGFNSGFKGLNLQSHLICNFSGMNRSASGSPVAGPGCSGETSSIGQWLCGLGLADYESLFCNNGFDDLDFIVST